LPRLDESHSCKKARLDLISRSHNENERTKHLNNEVQKLNPTC
jgi:hypothetical protein